MKPKNFRQSARAVGGGLLAFAAALTQFASNCARAATDTWIGGSGAFSTNANWSLNLSPSAGDNVIFPANAAAAYTVNLDAPFLSQSLGSIEVDGYGLARTSYPTTLTQSLAGVDIAAGSEYIGYVGGGTAIYTQSDGVNTTSTLFLSSIASISRGIYNLSGAAVLNVNNDAFSSAYIGGAGPGIFNQNGGTFNARNVTVGSYLGSSSGSYNLQSGALSSAVLNVGYSAGTGIFTQSGGSVSVSSRLLIGQTTGTGNYQFQGGTLDAAALEIDPNGVFNQVGGTLSSTTVVNQRGGAISGIFSNNGVYNFSSGAVTAFVGNNGVMNVLPGSGLSAQNLIFNQGLINLPATAALHVNASNMTNAGTVAMTGGTLDGTNPVVNNGLIAGFGTIGGAGGFTNNLTLNPGGGTLVLNKTGTNRNLGTVNLSPGYSFQIDSSLSNSGTINVNGGQLGGAGALNNAAAGTIAGYGTLANSGFSNDGTLLVQGGTLNIGSAFTSTGVVQLTSGGTMNGAAVTNSGAVQGAGKIVNAIANTGTIEAVNGTLSVQGAVTNTGAGAINATSGNQLILSGLPINAAAINLEGGVLDTASHALGNTGTILGFGTLRTGGLTNSGAMTLSGGSAIIAGDVTNAAAGNIMILYSPALFTGNVINNGAIKVTKTTVTFAGAFTNNGTYNSDPADNRFATLRVGGAGALLGGAGDRFIISGDLLSTSANRTVWDTGAAQLSFTGGGTHRLSITGDDLGSSYAGFENNFSWGTLSLDSGDRLVLEGPGALYVHVLDLGSTAALSNIAGNGANVYYDPSESANAYLADRTYPLPGGGVAAPVPEPALAGLLPPAGLLLLGRRRRGL